MCAGFVYLQCDFMEVSRMFYKLYCFGTFKLSVSHTFKACEEQKKLMNILK